MKGQDADNGSHERGAVVRAGAAPSIGIDLGQGPVKVDRSFSRRQRVAVTPAGNDDIGEVLRRLDIKFETVRDSDLCDRALLARFSTVFLNCSSVAVEQAGRSGPVLAAWVAEGGSLSASDWAGAYIHAAFPSVFDGEHCGCAGRVRAAVLHREVQRLLGTSQVDLHLDMASWYRVSRFAPSGNRPADVYLAEGRSPLMLAFRHGSGQVVFTSFHNRAQPGEIIDKLLRFLVLVPVVRSPTVATHVLQLAGGSLRKYLELESRSE